VRDVALWLSGGGLVALLGLIVSWRADKARTQVAKQAGYVEGYDRLVDDLQTDNKRLREEITELRVEIKGLRVELAGLPAGPRGEAT
jgi:predicted RNase H-like nuclease (RuvC/YqgF family)